MNFALQNCRDIRDTAGMAAEEIGEFSRNLRAFQASAGLTNEEFARKANVQLRALTRWRNLPPGKYPRVDQVVALAVTLGVSLDALVGCEPPATRREGDAGRPLVPPPVPDLSIRRRGDGEPDGKPGRRAAG